MRWTCSGARAIRPGGSGPSSGRREAGVRATQADPAAGLAGLEAIRREAEALAGRVTGVGVEEHRAVFATNSEAVLDWPRRYLAPVCTFGEVSGAPVPRVGVVRASTLHRRCRELIAGTLGEPSSTYEDEPATRLRAPDGGFALAYARRAGVTLVNAERDEIWFVTD